GGPSSSWVATCSFWTCARTLNPKRLLSRPAGTLSSIRNGGEGWGEEALQFMESHLFLLDLCTDLEPEAPPLPPFGHPLLHSEWRRGMGRGGAPVHGKGRRPACPPGSAGIPAGANPVGKNSIPDRGYGAP